MPCCLACPCSSPPVTTYSPDLVPCALHVAFLLPHAAAHFGILLPPSLPPHLVYCVMFLIPTIIEWVVGGVQETLLVPLSPLLCRLRVRCACLAFAATCFCYTPFYTHYYYTHIFCIYYASHLFTLFKRVRHRAHFAALAIELLFPFHLLTFPTFFLRIGNQTCCFYVPYLIPLFNPVPSTPYRPCGMCVVKGNPLPPLILEKYSILPRQLPQTNIIVHYVDIVLWYATHGGDIACLPSPYLCLPVITRIAAC